jgi:hypothetical protein
MVNISLHLPEFYEGDYGRKALEEELSLLTGAVLCSRQYLIRLDGNDRRQPRVSQVCVSAAERQWRLWWNKCRGELRKACMVRSACEG